MPLSNEAKQRHEELVQAYIAALPTRLAEIKSLWRRARWREWRRGSARRELYRIVHQLAGSGAVFGFPEITDQARCAVTQLSEISEGTGVVASGDRIDRLEHALEALCAVLAKAASSQGQAEAAPEKPVVIVRHRPPDAGVSGLIYLVEDDQSQASSLVRQLSAYGYQVKVFSDIETFLVAAQNQPPQAVIMDIIFPAGPIAGIDAVRELNRRLANPCPVLFLSVRSDLRSRIEALQVGAAAYFAKPVNPGDLVDRLDDLLRGETAEAYRVLIVDDDRELANLYQQALREAGMETRVVIDPLQVMAPLVDFRPELLLLDFTMPGCSGLDLAVALRQEPTYTQLPIVFVSQETDPRKRLACIGLGADDFVDKPVAPDYLVSLVTARLRRNRQLQRMIARDSLTGLLNHHAFMERFEDVLAMIGRGQVDKLTLAMIDLDRFKSVNDRYGHLAGDIALKNVARLLIRRLRSTDIVGRYGGEEFVVVLVEAGPAAARLRLNRIREEIMHIPNPIGDYTFHVTFSAGITGYDRSTASEGPPPDANELIRAADQALYQAKRGGGNRVVVG